MTQFDEYGNSFQFNADPSLSQSQGEEYSNMNDKSGDWKNLKRDAEFDVDCELPAEKKCKLVRRSMTVFCVLPLHARETQSLNFSKESTFPPCVAQKDEAVNEMYRTDNSSILLGGSDELGATEDVVDDFENPLLQVEQFRSDWKITCDVIMSNPEGCPHQKTLKVICNGMEERQAVQAALEQMFDEVVASLGSILEETLACAVPVHEEICNSMSNLENDILTLFRSNHDRRLHILHSLDSFNDMWQKKYSDFTSRALLESNQENEHETLSNANVPGGVLGNEALEKGADTALALGNDHDIVETAGSDQDTVEPEPDWGAIVELNPSLRSNIEVFLNGSNSWNVACEEFLVCFDEIRQAIEMSHSNILEILESAYFQISDELDSMQIDVQEHIMSNTARREQIERALEQVVLQQQTVLSRLMARVGSAFKTHPAN